MWAKHPGSLLKKPALSVCDQLKTHTTDITMRRVKDLNTQLAVIPRGLSSQLQPFDVSINQPFKAFMHEEWMKWLEGPHHDLTSGRQTK
jgi:hypothetical protein